MRRNVLEKETPRILDRNLVDRSLSKVGAAPHDVICSLGASAEVRDLFYCVTSSYVSDRSNQETTLSDWY